MGKIIVVVCSMIRNLMKMLLIVYLIPRKCIQYGYHQSKLWVMVLQDWQIEPKMLFIEL